MARYTADNFLQIPHNGAYGNKSVVHASIADASDINGNTGIANGDTLDLFKVPAGSKYLEGFLYVGSAAFATSTVVVGVRAADGTSTGLGTGTAVLVAGTASAITAAHTRYQFRFKPFTMDFDTIVYITWLSPGAPSGGAAGAELDAVLSYEARGTK